MSSSNSTGGVLEGDQSSEYEEKLKKDTIEPKRVKLIRKPKRVKLIRKPKRVKIELKRAKLMRKLKRAKIGPKRAQIGFCNVGGTRVMVAPILVNVRGPARTRS